MAMSVIASFLFLLASPMTAAANCPTSGAPEARWTHHVGRSAELDLPPGWAIVADGPDGFSAAETATKKGRGSVEFGVRQPRRDYRYSDFRGDVERVISSDRRQGRVKSVSAFDRDGTSFVTVIIKSIASFGSRVVDTYIKVPQEDVAPGGYMYVFALESLDGVASGRDRARLIRIYNRMLKSLRVRVPFSGPDWTDNVIPSP